MNSTRVLVMLLVGCSAFGAAAAGKPRAPVQFPLEEATIETLRLTSSISPISPRAPTDADRS
jgi:hypothetical protein